MRSLLFCWKHSTIGHLLKNMYHAVKHRTRVERENNNRNGLHNGISPVSFGPSASTAQSMAAVPLLIIVEKRMNLRINSNFQRNPHLVCEFLGRIDFFL